jgi:DNA-binding response OmpR family regulator
MKVPPFIFTTVLRDKELQAKVKQFGALAVLDKPLDIDDLREIVNSSLRRTEARTSFSPGPQLDIEQIAMHSASGRAT